jgi:ABC-type antimicrobial peptide transport system permease subunit
MKNPLKQWFIYSLVSAAFGFILGYVLTMAWFFLRLLILGYRDSGPSWGNTVTDVVFYGGLLAGVIGGQLLFFLRDRVESFPAKLARKKKNS